MQTRIDDLLDKHNEMWITLHRLKKATAEHKSLKSNPPEYYEVFALSGELESDLAKIEMVMADYSTQYQEQYNQLKNLTETI